MSVLGRWLSGAPTSLPPKDHDWWFGSAGSMSAAGVRVTPEAALSIGAVFACVRVIAEAVAQLPLHVYRRVDEGKERAGNHPVEFLLSGRPNAWQTSYEYREMQVATAVLRGNAYARIVEGPRGFADQLVPIHPDLVEVEQLENGRRRYTVHHLDGGREALVQDEVHHLMGLSLNGVTGCSPIHLMRNTIGEAFSQEEFAARQWRDGAKMSGVLQHPEELSAQAKETIRADFDRLTSGRTNWHSPLVLEEGMTWQSIGMSAEDAEFLASRNFKVTEIARWFKVQPHLVQQLDKATYSNIEHEGIGFVIHTVLPWCRRIEAAIARDLIIAPQKYFAEHNVDGLLRGDVESRMKAHATGVQWGFKTRNEVREQENLNRLDGLDEPLTPLNMTASNTTDEDSSTRRQQREQDPRTGAIARVAAERLVRRERASVQKWATRHVDDRDAWGEQCREFYAQHQGPLAQALALTPARATAYCTAHLELLGLAPPEEVLELVSTEAWFASAVDELVHLALEEAPDA